MDGLRRLLLRTQWAERVEARRTVAGCERFLAGGWLEVQRSGSDPVPEWAWANALAHGSLEDLQTLAASPGSPGRPELSLWARVASHVADEVLRRAAEHGEPLAELQRRVLVPVELQMLERPIGPSMFLRLVLGGPARRDTPAGTGGG